MERPSFNVKDAAQYLGISFKALYDIVEKKKIGHYRLGASGGAIRFRQEDLDDYLEACRQPAGVAAPPKKNGRQTHSLKGLPRLGHCLPASRRV